MKDDFQDELEFATNLAYDAGDIILQYFQVGVASSAKKHEGNTPVTIADTTVNSMVIEAIKQKYPDHAVLGEEESHHVEGAEYTWVCDPIDGTIPFVMGIPTNVFSIALVDSNGQPVVAVVFDPYMKRLYSAVKSRGAFMNDKSMHVNSIDNLEDAIVAMSGSRSNTLKPAEFKGALIKKVYRGMYLNSSIYEAMLVASGQMAATVYLGKNAHDVATTKLIVEEAGGKVSDVFGNEQRYDEGVKGVFASNGRVHTSLVELGQHYKIASQS